MRSKGLSQREQTQILDLFRTGKYNVLVATSVAEEGLDIPEVQMVLFYDCTPSAIRNIQRRGRTGRKGAGKVVILMTENTREEAYHWAGQQRERRMREFLKRLDGDLKNRQMKLSDFA
jgi:Fanconi anemia group M protein